MTSKAFIFEEWRENFITATPVHIDLESTYKDLAIVGRPTSFSPLREISYLPGDDPPIDICGHCIQVKTLLAEYKKSALSTVTAPADGSPDRDENQTDQHRKADDQAEVQRSQAV